MQSEDKIRNKIISTIVKIYTFWASFLTLSRESNRIHLDVTNDIVFKEKQIRLDKKNFNSILLNNRRDLIVVGAF